MQRCCHSVTNISIWQSGIYKIKLYKKKNKWNLCGVFFSKCFALKCDSWVITFLYGLLKTIFEKKLVKKGIRRRQLLNFGDFIGFENSLEGEILASNISLYYLFVSVKKCHFGMKFPCNVWVTRNHELSSRINYCFVQIVTNCLLSMIWRV